MKKKLLCFATIALAMSCMTSCSDDDYVSNPDAPKYSAGAYFLCQGNFYSAVPGGLYGLDYASQTMTDDLFSSANNGQSLGDTPQCGICYGSKIYLGIYVSNSIIVMDKSNNKLITRISLANKTGQEPRSMVAHGGNVYISMYDGYVCRLDTTKLDIDASVKVGPNPEIMGLYNNKLYVPNSDGMSANGFGKTASVIDLSTFKVTETLNVPQNPYIFAGNSSGLYLLCRGNYADEIARVYKVEGKECKAIAPATLMYVASDKVYMIDAPFGKIDGIDYSIYDCNSKSISALNVQKVDYPNAISVDEIGQRIFISSYIMDGKYPSYTSPGYVNEYSMEGSFVKKFTIGVGDPCIFYDRY